MDSSPMAKTTATEIDPPKPRSLSLADAMILIIALGLGLALTRPAMLLIADAILSDPQWRFQSFAGAVSLLRMLNVVLLNFLFFFLPAYLIIRLRRPRPGLRSMICQPGFAACAAPVVIVLATLPVALIPIPWLPVPVIEVGGQILLVVTAPLAWIFLIATRRWNPEPSWIDRLGCILGVLAMICTPLHFLLIRLPY